MANDRSIKTLSREVTFKSTKVDQLTQELAQYKRVRFGKSSEKLDAVQASLFWTRRSMPAWLRSKKS